MLYLDLNDLKETNDRYGHKAGDELLRALSRAMHRAGEAAGGADCYRIGGDEFLMTLRDCTEESLSGCAGRLALLLAEETAGGVCKGTVAVGQAFSAEPCPFEKLVSRADQDMYRVKQLQKSQPPRDPPQEP